MSKPDWKDAPDDMHWVAQDLDGGWWWYMDKPVETAFGWMTSEIPYRHQKACNGEVGMSISKWRDTLERRP